MRLGADPELEPLKHIGLIGCGVVGVRLGSRLLRAGFQLAIHDRHRERGEPLLAKGAAWVDRPAELAQGCHALLSALPQADDLRDALLGEHGAWSAAAPGTIHVDTSTIGVAAARTLAEEARRRRLRYLDAPLSAAEASLEGPRLSLFVAGNADHFDLAGPLLRALADHVHYTGGPPGSGQAVKLVNNLVSHGLTVILGDALALGLKSGVPIELLRSALHDGTAQCRILDELLPASVFRGDWRPGLRLDLALKDLALAEALAEETGVAQPLLGLVRARFEEARARGWGAQSSHAILRLVEESAGVSYVSPIFQRAQEAPDS